MTLPSSDIVLLGISILLFTYGFLNLAISPPPSNLTAIPSLTSKTFCLPVLSATQSDKQNEDKIRQTAENAYGLLVATFVSASILLILFIYNMFSKTKRPLLGYLPQCKVPAASTST